MRSSPKARDLFTYPLNQLLNAEFFPDAPWSQALTAGNEEEARRLLVREFREGPPRFDPAYQVAHITRETSGKAIGQNGGHRYVSDDLVNLKYQGVYAIVHQFEEGLDWKFDPTADWGPNKTLEWVVQMNRHYQWVTLADSYRETGDSRYVEAWRHEFLTWCEQQTFPDHHHLDYHGGWRNIEVGIRASRTWPYAWEAFRKAPEVTDDEIWLMAEKFYEHGLYVLNWPMARNFKAMEGNGMAWAGLLFPEFRHAPTFLSTALDRLMAEHLRQFMPDGCQDELSPAYSYASIINFYSTVMAAQDAFRRYPSIFGRVSMEIPLEVWYQFHQQIGAVQRISDPNGYLPPLGDSDPRRSDNWRTHLPLPAEWKNMLSPLPKGDPWDVLPYGGYATIKEDKEWGLFEFGAYGTAHQHSDALQFLFYDKGAHRLVDCEKPLYNSSDLTRSIRSSIGHNVASVAGTPHLPWPLMKKSAVKMPYAQGSSGSIDFLLAGRQFKTLQWPEMERSPLQFDWSRLVGYQKDLGYILVDWLETANGESVPWEWSWHLNHTLSPKLESDTPELSRVQFSDGYAMDIHSPAKESSRTSWVLGQEKPFPRGWRISPGDEAETLPVLVHQTEKETSSIVRVHLISGTGRKENPAKGSLRSTTTKSRIDIQWSSASAKHRLKLEGDPRNHLSITHNNTQTTQLSGAFLNEKQVRQVSALPLPD